MGTSAESETTASAEAFPERCAPEGRVGILYVDKMRPMIEKQPWRAFDMGLLLYWHHYLPSPGVPPGKPELFEVL